MDRVAPRAGSPMQEDGGLALGIAAFLDVDIMAVNQHPLAGIGLDGGVEGRRGRHGDEGVKRCGS